MSELSNLYFITIATMSDAEDFTDWLREKRRSVACNDTADFADWMQSRTKYPFAIFLDGATYEFKTEIQMLFFLVGFEAAMGLRFND